jgi:protein-arginine deiminase
VACQPTSSDLDSQFKAQGTPTGSSATSPPTTPGTTTPGTPTTETTETTTTAAAALEVDTEVIGIPNLDDEDGNGILDYQQRTPLDDDYAACSIRPSPAGAGVDVLELTLNDASGYVRVWHDGQVLLDLDTTSTQLPWQADPIDLQVEFAEFLSAASLDVVELDANGTEVDRAAATLTTGPLILNHHLQQTEEVWAVSVRGNEALIDGYTDALGSLFTEVPGAIVTDDVWFQDEFEWSTATAPGGLRLDVVIDSIRNRGLGRISDDMRTSDSTSLTWGSGNASSLDSFGNLEVSPPVTVNGVYYPFGRVYFGGDARDQMHQDLRDFLQQQAIQAPFQVDSTWLCVGHVDEWMSTVEDPTAPQGFRLVYTDVDVAWDVLDNMDPSTPLPKYAPRFAGHNYDTVGDIVNDNGLRNLNEDLKQDYLLPILQQMKDELGLTDDEVVLMPGLFEEPLGCGRSVAALIPGMANLFSVSEPGQPTKIFTADPFLRQDSSDQSTDPMIAEVVRRMPPTLEFHFLDDWSTYHMGLGEVHCGTNGRRTPSGDWW